MQLNLKKKLDRDFPGSPVGKTPSPQCKGLGFDPWSENQIPHAATEDPVCLNKDPAQPDIQFFLTGGRYIYPKKTYKWPTKT